MKQKDIVLIAVIAFISAMVSLVLSQTLFSSSAQLRQNVELVEKISSDFPPPGTDFFNDQSINPTKNITIGNPNP